jgi:hypothetical protein
MLAINCCKTHHVWLADLKAYSQFLNVKSHTKVRLVHYIYLTLTAVLKMLSS